MAIVGFFLYFYFGYQSIGILIFTVAAILDGVDGIVARSCDLVTRWGEWLDPFCDKLTYLPPMLGFAYAGILSPKLVWILIAIELVGQFFARHILKLLKTSGAANNFGKLKPSSALVLSFSAHSLKKNPFIVDIGDEVLIACIILSAASLFLSLFPINSMPTSSRP